MTRPDLSTRSFASLMAELGERTGSDAKRAELKSRQITEGLVRALRAAGMECKTCQGWGSTAPEDGPLGCDVCNDPHCYRNEGLPRVTCPTCHGSRIAPEFEQEPRCECGRPYVEVMGSGDLGCEECWKCAHCGTGLSDDEGQCPACHADDYEMFYDR
jgi:hypothetical protein